MNASDPSDAPRVAQLSPAMLFETFAELVRRANSDETLRLSVAHNMQIAAAYKAFLDASVEG